MTIAEYEILQQYDDRIQSVVVVLMIARKAKYQATAEETMVVTRQAMQPGMFNWQHRDDRTNH